MDPKSKGWEMTYFVEGLTNVHGGEGNVRRIAECETLEDAIRTSQQVVDEFLIARRDDGMTATDLFSEYRKFGEVPFIFVDGDVTVNVTGFNHLHYAMIRCGVLCTRSESESAD